MGDLAGRTGSVAGWRAAVSVGEAVKAGHVATAREVASKLERVRAWLDRSNLDALLLSSQANFAWITAGGRSHVSIGEPAGVASVLVTREAAYVLTPNIERRRIVDEEIGRLGFEVLDYPWHRPEAFGTTLAALCDPVQAVSDLGIAGLAHADDASVRADDGYAELRRVLHPKEQERYRALGRDAADALETAAREAHPGDTELNVAARIADGCMRRDIVPLVNLVASDERIARYRHPIPTSSTVGRTLLVALTGRRHGLHASLTRMISFGAPDDDLRSRHEAVQRVDAQMIAASVPGASLREVLQAASERYDAEGFPGEWKLHHQGGLTGYAGREIFATPTETYRLRADQALAWNPSITRVKSEDTVLITADGAETLTVGDWPTNEMATGPSELSRPSILVR